MSEAETNRLEREIGKALRVIGARFPDHRILAVLEGAGGVSFQAQGFEDGDDAAIADVLDAVRGLLELPTLVAE